VLTLKLTSQPKFFCLCWRKIFPFLLIDSDPKNNGSDSDHPSRSVSEPETRLVVALSGCASNLAGCSDGRRFISGNPIGNDVTRVIANLVLTNLSNLPTPVEGKTIFLFAMFFRLSDLKFDSSKLSIRTLYVVCMAIEY